MLQEDRRHKEERIRLKDPTKNKGRRWELALETNSRNDFCLNVFAVILRRSLVGGGGKCLDFSSDVVIRRCICTIEG